MKNTKKSAKPGDLDFCEIIEKEVNYLISYLDESLKGYLLRRTSSVLVVIDESLEKC